MKTKKKNNFPLLVAESEEGILGYVTYGKFREREAYKTTVEYSVYIHRNHRRKGIARKLVVEIINIARNQGVHSIIGGLDAGNKESYQFHLEMGFKEVAHFSQVARKFDQWLDLTFFQLLLKKEI